MSSFADIDKNNNGNYLILLSTISKLSGLFSDSTTPFIYYRAMENIFCRSFNADNLSRSDTAFDAKYGDIGIGLKTFVCPKTSNKLEKVAEFNNDSKELRTLKGELLAFKLAELRNARIDAAIRNYEVTASKYHIVARREKELLLFETNYSHIDLKNLHLESKSSSSENRKEKSLQFSDGQNFYSYNFSKSTLFKKFEIPNDSFRLPIEIIEDPFKLLLEFFQNKKLNLKKEDFLENSNFVILPLYGFKKNKKFVFEKSGLNQWNAGGRKRDFGEVYIPIPISIHNEHPSFFPDRDKTFKLQLPTGKICDAKVCQDNSKALMTHPNNAISDWLLRKVLQLKEGELAKIEKLEELGFDSVIVTKINNEKFKIDIKKSDEIVS